MKDLGTARKSLNQYLKDAANYYGIGPTSLIAAMRCYVASKMGDKVDIPEELLLSRGVTECHNDLK